MLLCTENAEIDRRKKLFGREYIVFPPACHPTGTDLPLVLLNGDTSMLSLMEQEHLLPLKSCIAVMPLSDNRLDDFTPWPEKTDAAQPTDFGGKADDYLAWLENALLPTMQKSYPLSAQPARTGIFGQSLGGLLALYAQTTKTGHSFGQTAAVSPSCWYPAFLPYMEKHLPRQSHTYWFLSTGQKEGQAHIGLKRNAVPLSRRMQALLTARYGKAHVCVQWDNGRHQDNLPLRYQKALSWLENRLSPLYKER